MKYIKILILSLFILNFFILAQQTKEEKISSILEQIENGSNKHISLQKLLGLCSAEELKEHSERLINLLSESVDSGGNIAKTLGILDLPIDLENKLLLSKNTPIEVKARLGNEEAQNAILEKFKNSLENNPSHHIMKDWGEKLLYMNTQEGLELFYQAIESDKFVLGPFNRKYSVAFLMIINYGEVFPQAEICQYKTLQSHAFLGGYEEVTNEESIEKNKQIFLEKKHQDCLRDLENYFLETKNKVLNINPPFFVIGRSIIKTIIRR